MRSKKESSSVHHHKNTCPIVFCHWVFPAILIGFVITPQKVSSQTFLHKLMVESQLVDCRTFNMQNWLIWLSMGDKRSTAICKAANLFTSEICPCESWIQNSHECSTSQYTPNSSNSFYETVLSEIISFYTWATLTWAL